MKKIILIAVALLAVGCQVKSEDPVVTTTGRVPLPVTSKTVTVQWGQASGVVQGYKIEISLDGTNFMELGTADGTSGGAAIGGIPIGHTYWFRVRAFNQGGNSGYGPVSSISI